MEKMMKNRKNRSVGRPSFQLVYPRGEFTINALIKNNPDVCSLTCRQHVSKGLRAKLIRRLKETVDSGTVGKPAFKYVPTARGLKSFTIKTVRNKVKVTKAVSRRQNVAKTETIVGPTTQLPVTTAPEAPASFVPINTDPPVIEAVLTTPVVVPAQEVVPV
jgi:hypothetical protein